MYLFASTKTVVIIKTNSVFTNFTSLKVNGPIFLNFVFCLI